jgi:hypothetical protein
MRYWRLVPNQIRGGDAWINHAAFVAIDAREFHPIVLSLARTLVQARIPERPSTIFVHAMHTSFSPERAQRRPMMTQGEFCGSVPGYLNLEIGRMIRGEPFERVVRDGQEYSILRGSFVSPWARSILEENEVDGLMLDTTWHVIRQYVTAILMAVFRNVGIPLAFTFGATENLELYERLYEVFVELFNIDLGRYITESDHGAALRALCNRHDQPQLICHRHFLLSLKLKEFSLPVGNLVKCRTGD